MCWFSKDVYRSKYAKYFLLFDIWRYLILNKNVHFPYCRHLMKGRKSSWFPLFHFFALVSIESVWAFPSLSGWNSQNSSLSTTLSEKNLQRDIRSKPHVEASCVFIRRPFERDRRDTASTTWIAKQFPLSSNDQHSKVLWLLCAEKKPLTIYWPVPGGSCQTVVT